MNIAFSNQKGGVGKTTLALLFANYLHAKNQTPFCLDFDLQASLFSRHHEAQELSDAPLAIPVMKYRMSQVPAILDKLKRSKNIHLFDLPGSLELPELPNLFFAMDLIICPFIYDPISFESTLVYAQILQKLNVSAPLVFIPNNVKTNVNYEIADKVDRCLSDYGTVAPRVKDWVDMQRITFGKTNAKAVSNTEMCFDQLYNNYIFI